FEGRGTRRLKRDPRWSISRSATPPLGRPGGVRRSDRPVVAPGPDAVLVCGPDRALRWTGGGPRADPAADRWRASDGTRKSAAGGRGDNLFLSVARAVPRRHGDPYSGAWVAAGMSPEAEAPRRAQACLWPGPYAGGAQPVIRPVVRQPVTWWSSDRTASASRDRGRQWHRSNVDSWTTVGAGAPSRARLT